MYYQPFSYEPNEYEGRQPQKVLREIAKAINDELQAVQYYTRLAELAPNNQFRQAVLAIRQDEIKHLHWFSRVYQELSGKYPPITLGVELPGSFKRGVRDSIKDEQEAAPFYRRIAAQISNQQISQRFLRAANDEQRHAQIFAQMAAGI
ncbi:ferritin family protein [Bacillota bacterium Lsc_1132]